MAAGYIFGFHVAGLRHPTSATSVAPILFTNVDVSASALPAAFSAFTVLPWVNPDSALGSYNWNANPRQPLGDAGEVPVEILDTASGDLGPALLWTPRAANWEIQNETLSASSTAIRIASKVGAQPTVNQVVWVENEALQVTGVSAVSSLTYDLTVTRARCGSLARYHRLDPANGFEDGTTDRMRLDSRPDYESFRFDAFYVVFQILSDGSISSTYLRRNCFVSGRPRPLKKGVYEITLEDAGDGIASHALANGDRETKLSHRIQVTEFNLAFGGAPFKAVAYLTRQEASRFFREPVAKAGGAQVDSTLVTALSAKLFALPSAILYYAEVEASGKYLYRITSVDAAQITILTSTGTLTRTFVRVGLQLLDRGAGDRALSDDESNSTNPSPELGVGQAFKYKDGWGEFSGVPLLSGEAAPKLTLRVQLCCKPVEALLYLAISDGADTGTTYDKIVGRVGAGLNPAWFNIGSAAGNPLSVDDGTTVLAERNQLLSGAYEYPISLKGSPKLGDFLNSLLLLHACLFGPTFTGAFCLRPWARPLPTSPATVVPIDVEIAPGKRLPVVRQLELESGFRPLTLDPEFTRTVRRRSPKRIEGEQTQKLRVWQRGNHISDSDITTGALGPMVRAFLDLLGGDPVVYEIALHIDDLFSAGTLFGDFVYWTHLTSDLPTDDGFGFSGTPAFLVLGLDVDPATGVVKARLIRDTYNDSFVSESDSGVTAPTLPVKVVKPVSSLTVDVTLESLGDDEFDGSNDHGEVWQNVFDDDGFVHVTRPVQGAQGVLERDGFLEGYATIDSIRFDEGTRQTVMRLTFDSTWARDGYTVASGSYASRLVVADETHLSVADYRPDGTHVQSGTSIEPNNSQLSASANFVKHTSAQTVDKVRHRIAS